MISEILIFNIIFFLIKVIFLNAFKYDYKPCLCFSPKMNIICDEAFDCEKKMEFCIGSKKF